LRLIYKLSDGSAWRAAQAAGVYAGSTDDRRDGFIHFSTAEQVPATAAKYFSDVRDLVVAAIVADALGAALKWEPSRGGQLFPHLYGPLDMAAVDWTRAVARDEAGTMIFPPEML
jgi:uncharacterized protein (DUF952 family)